MIKAATAAMDTARRCVSTAIIILTRTFLRSVGLLVIRAHNGWPAARSFGAVRRGSAGRVVRLTQRDVARRDGSGDGLGVSAGEDVVNVMPAVVFATAALPPPPPAPAPQPQPPAPPPAPRAQPTPPP